MGLYLNQLPPTEVARVKAELAETLIANFCYPRFYDYRVNALRMRPVDRAKRQEVWLYLNAVDFNVWGRVDVDSPDFQHQVERLFIHFVQRNRNFFGEQGRKRMGDVRSLIASCSAILVEGLRKHLQGKQGNPPLGSPRLGSSWSTTIRAGHVEPGWEQILAGTMQLQQQLQETRGEVRPAAASTPAPGMSASSSIARGGAIPNAASRRARTARPAASGAINNGSNEEGALAWPSAANHVPKSGEARISASFPAMPQESHPPLVEFSPGAPAADAAPTLPLPLGKPEGPQPTLQARIFPDVPAPQPGRSKRMKAADSSPAVPLAPIPPAGQARRSATGPQSAPKVPALAPAASMAEMAAKQGENATALLTDEDMVIFEQLRYQLVVWLRVEAVRSGIELSGQGAFQLVETLRHQDGVDVARLQVVSTLLNMCDQIITSGRASLFDYKQAMMFYLMHTRRTH